MSNITIADIRGIKAALTSTEVVHEYFWAQRALIQPAELTYEYGEISLMCKSEISVSVSCNNISHSFVFGLSAKVDYQALTLEPHEAIKALEAKIYITEGIINGHSGYLMTGTTANGTEYRELRNSIDEVQLRRAATEALNEELQASINKGEPTALSVALVEVISRAFYLATQNMQTKIDDLQQEKLEACA